MSRDFLLTKIALPEHPCQRCPSSEWLVQQGIPTLCARCKHPYPKYAFTSKEEEHAYQLANQTLNEKDFDLAYERFQHYVKTYPKNPDGIIGWLLSTYKISYDLDPKTGMYIPRNHDISLPPNLDKESLFKEALEAFKALGDDEAFRHWQDLALKLNQTIKSYNLFIKDAKPCEIFISFKHTVEDLHHPGKFVDSEDVKDAEKIYEQLLKHGYSDQQVFFSKVDNRQYTGDFEAKIYYKLQTAKQLILIGSSLDYLESPWVKNEWSRYLMMMKQGQKHPESFLFVLRNKETILSGLDERLKRFNILDLDEEGTDVSIADVVKRNQEKILGFTPMMSPVALENLVNQSETIEEEAKFLQSKSTIAYQKNMVTDFEKIEVNRLEIEWHNRNLAKAKTIAEKINKDYPNNATALKYLFLIEAKINDLSALSSIQWMNDKEDLQTLFNYLTSLPYPDRTPLIQTLMATSLVAIEKKIALVYPLVSFFLLTPQLVQDPTIIPAYVNDLKTLLLDQPDFSLFEIITIYDHKEVTAANLPLYLTMLGKINKEMTSSVSLKYLIRILKYDAKVLEQPFPYHIFKRVLFFEFKRLIQTNPYSHKTANVIMQIAGYMKADQVAFEFHHLFIRHTLTLGLFEEANQYIQSLQALGEKSEHIDYYRFFVEQKITSIDHILLGTPVLADATFEMLANRLLSTDNLRLAKQWLLLQDLYTKVRTMDSLYPTSEKAMKDYFKPIKFDGAFHWQYKIGLFAKHYDGPIYAYGEEIISNVFFESISLFSQPVIYLGKLATLMFRGDYVFQYPFQLHLHPGVKFVEGDQTIIIRTPLDITVKKGEDSDILLIKIHLLDTYQLAKLGDAEAMNRFGILSAIGIERFEDFATLPEVQQSLVRFLLNQHVEDAKTWLNQSRKYHAFASLIAKTMIDVPMLSTPSLMGLLSGQALGKPKPMTIQIFKDAVEGYSPQAMHNLAYFYRFGEGVDKRVDLAADLWMKAVERGESFSEGSLYNAVLIHQELLKDEKIKDFIQLYKKEVFLAKEVLEKNKKDIQPVVQPPLQKPVEVTSPAMEAPETQEHDIWALLNHANKAIAKETFAKIVDQHQAGQVQATLLLSTILIKGFQYIQKDIDKALQILEQSCLHGNKEACQRFIDVVKDGIMKNTIAKTESLRQRILTIQQALSQS